MTRTPSIFAATGHLAHAVAVNLWRAPRYAWMSRGRSIPASVLLVSSELALLPSLFLMDVWALGPQSKGVPVLARDLMPMAPLPEPGPAMRPRMSSRKGRADVRDVLDAYLASTSRGGELVSLGERIARTRGLLSVLRALEHAQGCHWAMHLHLVESLGLALEHLAGDLEQNKHEAKPIVEAYEWMHRRALKTAWVLDVAAQWAHASGAGILVRDVPPIPFDADGHDAALC